MLDFTNATYSNLEEIISLINSCDNNLHKVLFEDEKIDDIIKGYVQLKKDSMFEKIKSVIIYSLNLN